MEKIIKYKKYIITIIVMLVLSILFINMKYLLPKKYEELPEVKLKEKIEKEKTFAIMISEDGNNYQKYESNEWPNDKYKFKEAKCADNNDNLVDNVVSFENGKATIKTDRTIYCTLYFDHKETIEILRENEKLASKDNLSEDLQGGMYRYQGTEDVANWICFSTNDLNECTDETDSDGNSISDGIDKYMYRIIGITKEGQLYLLKETFLKEGTQKAFSWNDKYSIDSSSPVYCDNGLCPEWNTSLLFKRINGTSNGEIQGSGYNDGANTDIFVDSSEYSYLQSGDKDGVNGGDTSSAWYNLIADHEWMYGDTITGYSDTATYTGDTVYAIETGKENTKHYVGTDGNNILETYTWSKSVIAKISLMYIHDYVYSYYDGKAEESRGNPKPADIAKNGWLFFRKDGYNTSSNFEWLSTRWGVDGASSSNVGARMISGLDGFVGFGDYLFSRLGVRPVFYLSSTAKIADGGGTKNSPFIINY